MADGFQKGGGGFGAEAKERRRTLGGYNEPALPTTAAPDPTYDAPVKSGPVQGGTPDTGKPAKTYGPGDV